jgi:hypothetical protein
VRTIRIYCIVLGPTNMEKTAHSGM